MVRRRGPRLTLAEKTELWRRWRQRRITECHWSRPAGGSLMSCGMKSRGQAVSPLRHASVPASRSR